MSEKLEEILGFIRNFILPNSDEVHVSSGGMVIQIFTNKVISTIIVEHTIIVQTLVREVVPCGMCVNEHVVKGSLKVFSQCEI